MSLSKERQNAFVAYLKTIADDPRVRAAGANLTALRNAVFVCVGEDFLALGRDILTLLVDRARPLARSVAMDTVGDPRAGDLAADMAARGVDWAFGFVADILSGGKPRSGT